MLLIKDEDIEKILKEVDIVKIAQETVEKAFSEYGRGLAASLPWMQLNVRKYKGLVATGIGYLKESEIVSSGVATWWYNEKPPISKTIFLINPRNGKIFCTILSPGYRLGWHRTGAAGAVAAKYLARKDSKVAGIIGAGSIARAQLTHLLRVREIERAYVYSRTSRSREEYAKEMGQKLGIDVIPVDKPEKATKSVDILVTATPSTEPIVKAEWIREGIHINAIGADTADKRELDGMVLKKADKLYIDEPRKVFATGEFAIPMQEGILTKEDISGTIGEVCAGLKPGRENDSEITIFKSTGMEIQGALLSYFIYKKAKEMGLGQEIFTVAR